MSVRTRADDVIDLVKEKVNDAVKLMSEIVVEQCDGCEDYRNSLTVFEELIEIRNKL